MRRPMMPAFGPRGILLLTAMLVVACDDSSSDSSSTSTSTNPPKLTLLLPEEGACVSIGTSDAAKVSFAVQVESMYLRPPGSCDPSVACGQLILTVADKDEIASRSAASVIDWPVGKRPLAERYGDFTVEISAVKDANMPLDKVVRFKDAAGNDLRVSRKITTKESCEGGSGGAGGNGNGSGTGTGTGTGTGSGSGGAGGSGSGGAGGSGGG